MPTVVSRVWGSVSSGAKSWWGGLNAHDKTVAIIVAAVIGFVAYQSIALGRARQKVEALQLQMSNMATKQQMEALSRSIADVDLKAQEAKALTDAARIETQSALKNLGKPWKSKGMKSNEIVTGFQSLRSNPSN
jgi:hypothetical protein